MRIYNAGEVHHGWANEMIEPTVLKFKEVFGPRLAELVE